MYDKNLLGGGQMHPKLQETQKLSAEKPGKYKFLQIDFVELHFLDAKIDDLRVIKFKNSGFGHIEMQKNILLDELMRKMGI